MLLAFHQRVKLIQKYFAEDDDTGSIKENQILIDLKNNLLSASELPTTSKMFRLHSFITVKFIYLYANK
jgi:hypothetical protein